MKRSLQKFLSCTCVLAVLISSSGAAGIADFPDASGHWAADALGRAVSDGLLHGNGAQLLPDSGLTAAEMAAILNRVLSAENTDRLYPSAPDGQWYTADAHKSASLGILPPDGTLNLSAPVTRGQVFQALAAAFGLEEAQPDESVLSRFSDSGALTPQQRRAAAVLVRDGIAAGAQGGSLEAARGITRAEFMSLIYRIWNDTYLTMPQAAGEGSADAPPATSAEPADSPQDDTTVPPDTAQPETTPDDAGPPNAAVTLYKTQPDDAIFPRDRAYGRVVLRGNYPQSLFSGGAPVSIDRLVLATTGSDLSLANVAGNRFGTIAIGGGTGTVTLSGTLTRAVEVTGSARTVDLRGLSLDSLLVSGTENRILADANTSIGTLYVVPGATDNRITLNGAVSQATLAGARTTLGGAGGADKITLTGKRCTVSLPAYTLDDRADNGLDGVQLSLTAPAVQPGGSVTASVSLTGVEGARVCAAQWYFDGAADADFFNPALTLEEGRTSTYRRALVFAQNMALSHTVGFRLTYRNTATGETETLYAEAPVTVQNYPDSHYAPPIPDAQTVLAKVHSVYKKGNTDYSPAEKTIFVNAKGYASPTKYLIWVSRSAQMVNVFEGSKGNWTLRYEFQCATGAAGMSTPVGVTYVTYKQTRWTTPTYTCRPIVRFYPGTGYAFHSRLYYPGTDRVLDGAMGYPVSHGCVRMMDEGIYWLYDNVPAKTTVVIF